MADCRDPTMHCIRRRSASSVTRRAHDPCAHSVVRMRSIFSPKLAFFWMCLLPYIVVCCRAQNSRIMALENSRNQDLWRSLDKLLQAYAFRALAQHHPRPRTGILYDAAPPANLSGTALAAIRLRRGSLKRYGVPEIKEFSLPKGIEVRSYVERLVLVYQNLNNWSSVYFDVPGYKLLAPVVGLLAYDAYNLNATNLQELNISATTTKPISIRFTNLSSTTGMEPNCIYFDLNGTVSLKNMTSKNVCSTVTQGHFSLAVESVPAPPGGISPPGFAPPPSPISRPKKRSNKWKVATGSTVGAVVGVALLVAVCFGAVKYREKSKIEHMEQQADQSVALQTSVVGASRAPIAGGTRTQPTLETEYTAS